MRWSCIIVLLIAAMLFFTGCNNTTNPTTAKTQVAVIDLQAIIKIHHLYPAWKLAKSNYEATEKLKQEQVNMLKTQLQLINNIKTLEQQGSNSFLQADYAVKMSQAYMKERAKLEEIKIIEKQKINELLKDKLDAIEKEYSLPMFNLKSKIEIINPLPRQREEDAKQKQELIEQLEKLMSEKRQKINQVNKQGDELLQQAMQKYETQSVLDLREYEKTLQSQLINQDKAKYEKDQQVLENIPQILEKTLQSIDKQLTEQDQARERLYQRMYDDIASQVNKIAIQNKIDVVLVDVKTNINAQDITEQVILALPKK